MTAASESTRRLGLVLAFMTGIALLVAPGMAVAHAAGGGATILCDPSGCHVTVIDPGAGGTRGAGGAARTSESSCAWLNRPVPCTDAAMGSFNSRDGCYYKVAVPAPTSGPVFVQFQRFGGGIYWVSCPFGVGSGGYVWLAQPLAGMGPTPGELAQRALDSLTLTRPSTGRYPAGRLRDGTPYAVVRAATWFFTDPADFRVLTARAAVGGVWARVTATPVALMFTPGDGAAAVSCSGPGTAWTSAYGVWDRSPSGCDYSYPHSSIHQPNRVVTATYGIRWQVSWVGSGGASGVLPDQMTTATATFAVAEVEAVVVR
jgi:hypothetical protein